MWQIIGQERIVNTLERSINDTRFSHAYLFTGPDQIGKKTLALNFACALNCIAEDKPCGECSPCRRILSGNHPDVQVIELTESDEDQAARKVIRKEQIEDMQYSINLNPYEGGYRVIIIDRAEYMSLGAANSLLKTLEEPPHHTVIVLLSVEQDRLLATIHSRCRTLEFDPVSVDQVRHVLVERMDVASDRAELVARLSYGRIGWAITAIANEETLEERSIVLENLISLVYTGTSERFRFAAEMAEQFAKNRRSVYRQLEFWLTWWRDLLLVKTGGVEFIANIDRDDSLRLQADQVELETVSSTIRAILETMQHLDQNANSRLALEVLMLNIPQIKKEACYA